MKHPPRMIAVTGAQVAGHGSTRWESQHPVQPVDTLTSSGGCYVSTRIASRLIAYCRRILLTPAFAKTKPTGQSTKKIHQDFARFTEIAGAEKVGADQCASCHTDLSKEFRHSGHALREVTCERCHGAGSLHVADGAYWEEKFIIFRDRLAEESNGVCLSCHAKSDQVRNWFAGAHEAEGLKCVDCHTRHTSSHTERTALVSGGEIRRESRPIDSPREMNDRCLQCHRKKDAQANLPYHHPQDNLRADMRLLNDPGIALYTQSLLHRIPGARVVGS